MEVDILVECAITGNQAEYEYDIDNTFLGFMKDINNDSPSLGFTPASIKDGTQSGDSGIIIDGRGFRFLEYSGDTLASLGVKNGSLIVITEPQACGWHPDQERAGASALKKKPRLELKKKVRPQTLVDIDVECAITGNQAEYEYDIDNTFLGFIKDLNNGSPSLGFTPSSIKQGTANENSGITIDGTGFRFLDCSGDTLASLGVKDGSLIMIMDEMIFCGGGEPYVEESFTDTAKTGALKKKPRSLLKKKVRPKLKKKPPRILIKIDPQSMSNLEILRAAALNEIRMDAKFISVDALRTHLEQLIIGKKKFRLSLPKKFRKKSFATPLGDIKYSNMLLWCDACKDIDLSSMHLHHACIELFGTSVADEKLAGDKVFSLVDTRCTTSGCTGTFRMWNLRDNPPKYV